VNRSADLLLRRVEKRKHGDVEGGDRRITRQPTVEVRVCLAPADRRDCRAIATGADPMAKKRTPDQQPWMAAPEYGRSLQGLSVNLLVRDVARAVAFQREVLGATVVYSDADFAVLRRELPGGQAEWMLHADHTYGDHPLLGLTGDNALRGVGAELRLHGCDPDAAAAAAERLGFTVLARPADKPHGLREAYLVDPDGYVWVPDVPSTG
jgi:catechol 2,3-dioxygenase-like lactoylglutathione lyase family enzyme